MPSCHVDLGAVRARRDGADAGAGDDLRARLDRGPGQRVGDRAHAADRHPPLAGAVADEVVEEAAVLDQRGVVQRGEGADERVGGDDAADGVVGEAGGDRPTERLGDDLVPDALVDQAADLALEGERLHQGGGDDLGQRADLGVERLPRGVLLVASGEVAERRTRRLALGPLDEQPAGALTARPGGVRRGAARGQAHVEVQVGHQLLRHQADQVGVAREPGGQAGEGLDGHRRAAGVLEALEHHDGEAGPREVGGAHQGVVAAADHDDVIAVGHRAKVDPGRGAARRRTAAQPVNVSLGTITARPVTRPCARSS